jgi:hypothetical protein
VAQPVVCDTCQVSEAVLLITFMPTGETLALCLPCSVPWADGIRAALAAADPDTPADTGEPAPEGAPATRGRVARASTPRRPRASRGPRPSPGAPPTAPGGAEGPDETAQPAGQEGDPAPEQGA